MLPNHTNAYLLFVATLNLVRRNCDVYAAGKRNLGLDYSDFTVILHGLPGLKLDQFEKEVRQLVSCVQPTSVFFEIGSNDLSDGEDSSVRCIMTAHRMVDLAIWVVAECHAEV